MIHRRPQHRRISTALLIGLGLAVASCNPDAETGPLGCRAPNPLALKTTIVALGTFRIPIPADNSDPNHAGAQADVCTGIIGAEAGMFYRVRVKGTVTVSINPAAQTAYPDADFPSVGSRTAPGGTGSGFYYLKVGLQYCTSGGCGSIGWLSSQGGASAPDSAYTDIYYADTQREIDVSRNPLPAGIGGPNGSFGKYLLSSQQDVTVEKVTDFVHLACARVRARQRAGAVHGKPR